MNREMETALALRGILKGTQMNVFVRFENKQEDSENLSVELDDSGAGRILHSALVNSETGNITVSVKEVGSYRISRTYDNSAEGEDSSGVAVVTGGAGGLEPGWQNHLSRKDILYTLRI